MNAKTNPSTCWKNKNFACPSVFSIFLEKMMNCVTYGLTCSYAKLFNTLIHLSMEFPTPTEPILPLVSIAILGPTSPLRHFPPVCLSTSWGPSEPRGPLGPSKLDSL